jgi:hypothetical protein
VHSAVSNLDITRGLTLFHQYDHSQSRFLTLKPKDLVSLQPVLTIPTEFLTIALALCRRAAAQHAVFAMLISHPTLCSHNRPHLTFLLFRIAVSAVY